MATFQNGGIGREGLRGGIRRIRRRVFTRERILALAKGAALIVLAFLFDRCEFLSVHPLGIAFLCGSESGLGFIYGGLLLSALPIFGGAFRGISIMIATAAVLLRVAARLTLDLPWREEEGPEVRTLKAFFSALFREHVALRVGVSAISAFLFGFYGLIAGGYAVYDLLGMLLSLVVTPIATLVTVGVRQKGVFTLRDARDLVSVIGFFVMLTASLSGAHFYRIALAVFASMGATLWLTNRKGIAVGILAGLAFGLAVDPVTAPLYAFGAICAGALRRVSVFMGALSALSVGMAWGFYVYGLSALSSLLPGLLSAALLYSVLERLGFLPAAPAGGDGQPPLPEESGEAFGTGAPDPRRCEHCDEDERLRVLRSALASERLRDEERKIEDLCGAFLSVSELLRALREHGKYPSAEEYRRVCDRVCDEFCPGCASCALCWGSEYARMAGVLGHMAEELRATGRVDVDAFPEEVRRRCHMSGAIFLRINEEAGALTEAALKQEKAGLLSADYSAAASLFRSASRSAPDAYGIDEARSRGAEAFLQRYGLTPSRVAVSGGRRGCLYAWNVDRAAATALFTDLDRIREAETVLGFLPSGPILTEIPGGGGLCDLRVPAAPRFSVERAHVSRSARRNGREEGFCGDSVSLFESGEGRSFALLSDGMGSGRNAAHLSGICTVFLQKMLSAGAETGVILRMLNDFLVAGAHGESSATVDLLDLDLYTGEGRFWKSGAAPTFILREGNLFRLTSRTAPAGILAETDAQKTEFQLYDGDVVLMVSDGISDGFSEGRAGDLEDSELLEGLLRGLENGESLERLAERIADGVRPSRSEEEMLDDRSVILLRVEACDGAVRVGPSAAEAAS